MKSSRLAVRNRIKLETESKDRSVMPTNRERAKEVCRNTYAL